MYSTRQYLCVRSAFLPQLIRELEEKGRTCFLEDPHGTLWAILDRTTMEVEVVVRMSSRLERVHNSRGRARGSAVHSSDEEGKDHTADHLNINSQYCMKDFLIYLKAMQLLLARYHPELHRVTPLHALCGILMKGVSAIFTLSRIAADMKGMKARRNNSGSGGEDKGGSESESKPAVDLIPAPI